MSNEINKLKNKLKVIKPLLQKDRVKLDEMKIEMQLKLDILDRVTDEHAEASDKKNALIHAIESNLGADNEISVSSINNSRYYLDQLEDALDMAKNNMDLKKHAVDKLREQMLDHQLTINKLEKYRDRKDQSLYVEMEKDHMHMMDELWMQKTAMEKNHE